MAVMYATGLLALGVPLWAGIGLLSGIIGIVPYLGVLSGMTLAVGFAAVGGAGPLKLLGVIAVFCVAQLIDDYVLTPRLIGDRLELHPMVVFIGLIVAGHLFGLIGFVLAIPVLGMLKVVFEFLDEIYMRSDFYRGEDLQHPEPKALRVREAVKAVTGRLTPPPGVMPDPNPEPATPTEGPQTF
jgi:predicted PurR-regulated permease PerM